MATCSSILSWKIPWTGEPGYSPLGSKELDMTEWVTLPLLHFSTVVNLRLVNIKSLFSSKSNFSKTKFEEVTLFYSDFWLSRKQILTSLTHLSHCKREKSSLSQIQCMKRKGDFNSFSQLKKLHKWFPLRQQSYPHNKRILCQLPVCHVALERCVPKAWIE